MPQSRTTVTVRLGRLRRFREVLESDLREKTNGPVREALRDWKRIYWEFINERFATFAAGGGDWPPLSPKTTARKAKLGLDPRILVATRLLEANLDPQFAAKPGEVNDDVPFGVRVSVGSSSDESYPGGKTVREVAMYHQFGGPKLPRRQVVVPPDADARAAMRARMKQALKELKSASS